MSNDLRADLAADLMSDLGRSAPLPSAPPVPTAARPSATPVVVVTVTPTRWSLPALDPTERGLGIAVRFGPVRVEVAL